MDEQERTVLEEWITLDQNTQSLRELQHVYRYFLKTGGREDAFFTKDPFNVPFDEMPRIILPKIPHGPGEEILRRSKYGKDVYEWINDAYPRFFDYLQYNGQLLNYIIPMQYHMRVYAGKLRTIEYGKRFPHVCNDVDSREEEEERFWTREHMDRLRADGKEVPPELMEYAKKIGVFKRDLYHLFPHPSPQDLAKLDAYVRRQTIHNVLFKVLPQGCRLFPGDDIPF